MWGSTTPNTKTKCNWTNAPFNNGFDSYNEEYFNDHKSEWLDDNNNLKPEYDAASQIMGGDWRMPTEAELQELLNNTTKKWITNFNGTGVSGRKFTSKTNGNSIFIPAAGVSSDGSVYSVGSRGNVWSSSLNTSNHSRAWYLLLSSGDCDMTSDYRYYGCSVRGVCK